MKRNINSLLLTVTLTAVLSVVAWRPCDAQYALTDLHPGDYGNSNANLINSSGRVVGYEYDFSNPYANHRVSFYWEAGGTPILLPVLPPPEGQEGNITSVYDLRDDGVMVGHSGGNYSNSGRACIWTWDSTAGGYIITDIGGNSAWDINANGWIVGGIDSGGLAGLWQPDGNGGYTRSQLPLPDTGRYESGYYYADSLNDAGLIRGWAGLAGYTGGVVAVWESATDPNGFHELPSLTRTVDGVETVDNYTSDWALSENGVIVGYSGDWDWNYANAVYWEKDGSGTWGIHELPGVSTVYAEATGITSSAGQIIGVKYDSVGPYTAVVWEKDESGTYQIQVLPALAGDTETFPNDINETGQIIGYSTAGDPHHAVIWQKDAEGVWQVTSIGTLGGTVSAANAINDAGLIVGTSNITGNAASHAFLAQLSNNQPPVLDVSSAPTSGLVGTPITFTATATDTIGDTLAFSLGAGAPSGATINSATGQFTWTPDAAGTFSFDVTVTDAGGLSDTKTVTVNVSPVSVLTFSNSTVTRRGKTVTITGKTAVTNPSASQALNTYVNTATLGGSGTTTALPLKVGTIRAGASKNISLTFKDVPAGSAILHIEGSCSLGNFFTTQSVTVP